MQPRSVAGLSVSGLALTAFRTFFRAPIVFAALAAVQLVPTFLLKSTAAAPSTSPFRSAGEIALAELIVALVQAPMLHRASCLLRSQPFLPQDALRTTISRALPVTGVTLLQFMIVGLGSIALLLPGVIAYLMLFLAAPICVAERTGPLQSLSRSADMTRGNRWRILGAVVLLLLPVVAIVVVVAVLASTSTPFDTDPVFDAVGAIAGCWLTILSAVIYEDLRRAGDQAQITEVFV